MLIPQHSPHPVHQEQSLGSPHEKQKQPLSPISVLTRKRATVAEAASAGRGGEGLQGDTVLLLRAARLDGPQVAVAAGAKIAGQRQVQCLGGCRLGFAAGRLAGCLILVAQICLPYLAGQRWASGASRAHSGGTGCWVVGSAAGLESQCGLESALPFLPSPSRYRVGGWNP